MINRKYIKELKELGKFSPVIGILGPRQVGKTTLVKIHKKKKRATLILKDLQIFKN